MIKVETIEEFTLKDFDKLKNIKRFNEEKNKEGCLFVGDTFECDENMAKYLTGNNKLNKIVVKVIEVIPEKFKTTFEEVEPPKEAREIKKPKKTKLTKKK